YVILVPAVGILMTGLVMLKGIFSKSTAYLGLVTGILGIVSVAGPPFVGALSLTVIVASVLTTVWVLFVGYRLYALGQPWSELFKDLFCFLGIVTDNRELDQIIRDAGYVDRFEINAGVAESVGDIGQYTGFVLEQYDVDFTLREPNARRLERAAGHHDIIGENARHRLATNGQCRESFDVDAAPRERLRHSGEIAGFIGELDRAVFH